MKTVLKAAALVLAMTTTAHAEPHYAFGNGAVDTCFDFLYRGTRPSDITWALGFISGITAADTSDVNNVLSSMEGGKRVALIGGWMTQYCKLHASDHVMEAVGALVVEMAKAETPEKSSSEPTQ